ncbi:MAG TPA: ABC transporter permease subunit [Nocardioides sp.]|uniref:ABC transporter permease n=1 Tax=Nocardioides sp. TaxID=35761 RepID=UPI002B75C380|nr:ABC transporter permease [Nocardioides sp.]HQR27843.1 ABC transporter permease subunit [Nocardioides sp.]
MTTATVDQMGGATRSVPARIPQSRVVGIELRKMFDTRSGFWLMASIVVTALLTTAAVLLFGGQDALVYDNFAAAVGVPMTIILPVVAILSVTSEWSQRSGLGTFTLVPHRGRVMAAKAAATFVVGVVSMAVALAVGALGNLVGAAMNGIDPVWDLSAAHMLTIVVADLLGMFLGFTLGVLARSSAAAVVGYFVITFVLPPLSALLAASQEWYRHAQPWVDFTVARNVLYDGVPSAQQWAQLAVASSLWLLLPLAVGLVMLRRAEVV